MKGSCDEKHFRLLLWLSPRRGLGDADGGVDHDADGEGDHDAGIIDADGGDDHDAGGEREHDDADGEDDHDEGDWVRGVYSSLRSDELRRLS